MIIEGDFYRKTLVLAIIGLFLVTSMIPVSSLSIDKESCESTTQPIEDLSFNSTFPYLRDDIDTNKGLSKIEDFEREVYEKYPWHYDQHLRNHSDYPFDEDMEKQGFWEPKLSLDIKVPDTNTNSIPVKVTLKNHRFLPIPVGEMDLMQLCDYGRTLDFEIVTPDQHTIYFMGGHWRKDDYRVWLIPFGKKYYLCDLTKKCFGEKEEECYSFLDNPGTYTIKAIYNSDGLAFAPNLILPHMVNTWDGHLESETKTFELEKSFIPTFDGNTLYVGGTGSGNYSKIQEAINDASDGDTIFVYSGTYDEKIILDKSLKLSGEKGAILRSTGWPPRVIEVNSTGCSIEGFTIKLSFLQTGIYVKNANTIISKNSFIHKTFDVYGSIGVYTDNAPNTIIQHNIFENTSGIYIINSKFTRIVNNTIITKENYYLEQRTAIRVESNQPSYTTILHNSIVDASGISCCGAKLIYGIILDSENNDVFSNEINNTYCGVYTLNCDNVIRKNNFLNTTAYFKTSKLCRIIDINRWEANYWGEPKKSYIIYGELYLKFFKDPIPWINIDWHPAQEPYDITAGGGV